MEHAEPLKSFLQDIINDRQEQAHVTMHDYIVSKTKEVAGLGQAPDIEPVDDDNDNDNDNDTDDE